MTKPAIGYVGVGLMGLPMVKRLVEKGYRVKAYDIIKDKVDAAVAAGASSAGSPADAAGGADFVLLNLPTTDAVECFTILPLRALTFSGAHCTESEWKSRPFGRTAL